MGKMLLGLAAAIAVTAVTTPANAGFDEPFVGIPNANPTVGTLGANPIPGGGFSGGFVQHPDSATIIRAGSAAAAAAARATASGSMAANGRSTTTPPSSRTAITTGGTTVPTAPIRRGCATTRIASASGMRARRCAASGLA